MRSGPSLLLKVQLARKYRDGASAASLSVGCMRRWVSAAEGGELCGFSDMKGVLLEAEAFLKAAPSA